MPRARAAPRCWACAWPLAAALFLLGWYVNAASAQLYGDGSPMVADNGVRMFAVIFTLVFHVIYLAFTRKKRGQA